MISNSSVSRGTRAVIKSLSVIADGIGSTFKVEQNHIVIHIHIHIFDNRDRERT